MVYDYNLIKYIDTTAIQPSQRQTSVTRHVQNPQRIYQKIVTVSQQCLVKHRVGLIYDGLYQEGRDGGGVFEIQLNVCVECCCVISWTRS